MGQTLVAWYESQDASASALNHAAVADPHVRVSGDYIYVPSFAPFLGGVIMGGATPLLASLRSPSLRKIVNLDIEPMAGAEPVVGGELTNLFSAPIPLSVAEGLEALIQAGAGAQVNYALAWLVDGPVAPVAQPFYTVRATNATTLVGGSWTNGALTFTQTLPAGRYAVVGMRARSAGLLAARLVIPGSGFRPGVPGVDTISEVGLNHFRSGAPGVMGEFDHDVPPTVDFLSVSADTSQVVFLDVVPL